MDEGHVTCVAFSPEGRTLAAGCDGGVVLWDLATRKRLAEAPLPVQEGAVVGLAFSPDGRTLATGYAAPQGDGGVVLWDPATRRRLAEAPLRVSEGSVTSVAFGPDGKTLAAGFGHIAVVIAGVAQIGGGDSIRKAGGVALWDVATRRRRRTDPSPWRRGRFDSVAFSPDGKTLAAGYDGSNSHFGGGGVVLWGAAARERLADVPLRIEEGRVVNLAFSPDGKALAAAFGGGGFFNASGVTPGPGARKRLAEVPIEVSDGFVTSVAFSPDGKALAAGHRLLAGGVVLWEQAGAGLAHVPVHEGQVIGVAFSPDGRALAAAFFDPGLDPQKSGVILWDPAVPHRLANVPLAAGEGGILCLAFSPDGQALATGGGGFGRDGGGGVGLWDLATRKPLAGRPSP